MSQLPAPARKHPIPVSAGSMALRARIDGSSHDTLTLATTITTTTITTRSGWVSVRE